MAAGDLITLDWQLELRGLLMGAGTPWRTDQPGWGGLGHPGVQTADVDLDQAAGVYPGRDYLAARTLTFPLLWRGTPAEVMDGLTTLLAAWQPSLATDLPLHAQTPGWGRWMVTGRPRGLAEDLSRARVGIGRALATFFCPDPAITFIPPPDP